MARNTMTMAEGEKMKLANRMPQQKRIAGRLKFKLTPAQPVAIERAGHCGLEETGAGWLAVSLGLLWLLHGRGA
jgi:hypothetical protein